MGVTTLNHRYRTVDRKHRTKVLFEVMGNSCRAHRQRAEMSIMGLASACGVDKATIERFEDGRSCPPLLMSDIAEALDISLDDLAPVGWEKDT